MAKQTPYQYSTDAKEIVRNVFEFCKQEKESWHTMSLHQAKLRATTLTGVSLIKNNRMKKSHPAKEEKPQLAKTERVQLDTFDLCVLQRIVNDMCSKQKTLPTLSNIRTALDENIGYTGSKSDLKKHMEKPGFSNKKSKTNRKLLI